MNAIELKGRGVLAEGLARAEIQGENRTVNGGGELKLREYIKRFISKKSPKGDLLYKIDNGRIRPSKALQDCLVSLMKGNEEFILLDDQAVVFDMCKKIMDQCRKDFRKRCIIIQGGPGTGKSVLAVNLLKEFISKGLNASYCTKNSAPTTTPTDGSMASIRFFSLPSHFPDGHGSVMKLPQAMKNAVMNFIEDPLDECVCTCVFGDSSQNSLNRYNDVFSETVPKIH